MRIFTVALMATSGRSSEPLLHATTHWRYTDLLVERYPEITVDPDVLFVEGERVYTSAGSAAGLDLGLHIIR